MAKSQDNQPVIPQISVRLAATTKDAFLAYSNRLGLDHSEVAKLLVIRERQLSGIRGDLASEAPYSLLRRGLLDGLKSRSRFPFAQSK